MPAMVRRGPPWSGPINKKKYFTKLTVAHHKALPKSTEKLQKILKNQRLVQSLEIRGKLILT